MAAAKFPLFVTWKIRSKSDWRLRGCIGTFSPKELARGLKEFALTSALRDSRFSPMVYSEVPDLMCDVSLLTDFEPAKHTEDWKIGVHGIQIDFVDPNSRGKSYSATYLPEVASEQGWSKSQTIEELIAKSGYKQSITSRLKENIKVTRYQSSKASLTYPEYLDMRDQIDSANRPMITRSVSKKDKDVKDTKDSKDIKDSSK